MQENKTALPSSLSYHLMAHHGRRRHGRHEMILRLIGSQRTPGTSGDPTKMTSWPDLTPDRCAPGFSGFGNPALDAVSSQV